MALPAAGEVPRLALAPGTDPRAQGCRAGPPTPPGGLSCVFFSPTLFGAGSDRLPWTKWLLLAGRVVASLAALALSEGLSPWDSFSCGIFIREGLAGFSFGGFSAATGRLPPLADEARGGGNLLATFF